jgi:hypothetical protein
MTVECVACGGSGCREWMDVIPPHHSRWETCTRCRGVGIDPQATFDDVVTFVLGQRRRARLIENTTKWLGVS